MKGNKKSKILLLLLLLPFVVGCYTEATEIVNEQEQGIRIKINTRDLTEIGEMGYANNSVTPKDIQTRSAATTEEQKVQNLLVFFVANNSSIIADNAKELKEFNDVASRQADGSIKKENKKYFKVDVLNVFQQEWLNNDVTSRTFILPLSPNDVANTTAYMFANLPAGKEIIDLDSDGKLTLADVKLACETFTKVEDVYSMEVTESGVKKRVLKPLLMEGQTAITTLTTTPTNPIPTITVNLQRAIAKIDIEFVIDYDKVVYKKTDLAKFVENFSEDKKASFQPTWQAQNFREKTYWLANANVDTTHSLTNKETSLTIDETNKLIKISTYLNEYDVVSVNNGIASSIVLKLPVLVGDDFGVVSNPSLVAPPPAGGYQELTAQYYRLILPKEIKRNGHYAVKAKIIGPGTPTADGAILIITNVVVKPWGGVVVIYPGDLPSPIEFTTTITDYEKEEESLAIDSQNSSSTP